MFRVCGKQSDDFAAIFGFGKIDTGNARGQSICRNTRYVYSFAIPRMNVERIRINDRRSSQKQNASAHPSRVIYLSTIKTGHCDNIELRILLLSLESLLTPPIPAALLLYLPQPPLPFTYNCAKRKTWRSDRTPRTKQYRTRERKFIKKFDTLSPCACSCAGICFLFCFRLSGCVVSLLDEQ